MRDHKDNYLLRYAADISPALVTACINIMRKRRPFTTLGHRGVLEVSSTGEIYGGAVHYQTQFPDGDLGLNKAPACRSLVVTSR